MLICFIGYTRIHNYHNMRAKLEATQLEEYQLRFKKINGTV